MAAHLLYLFALTNLVIGTGAFMLTGILEPVAHSLGVGVASVAHAMTAYALAAAFIAPLLVAATSGWTRSRAMLLGLGLFTLGASVSALAPSLQVLLAGRVLMGAGSMFLALAVGTVVSMVEPARRGRALALIFIGMTLSYALGLPLGAWAAFAWGWRVPVWFVVAAAAACAGLLVLAMPQRVAVAAPGFKGLGRAIREAGVLRVWLRTLLNFIAIFSVFSFVGPVLSALNHLGPGGLSLMLVWFGLWGVVGTASGGWAVDRFGAVRTLRVQLAVFALMMILVPLTRGSVALCALAFAVWGLAGFGTMVPQQVLLGRGDARQAPLLLSLNTSILYAGTALGTVLSAASAAWVGFGRLAWVGVPFAVASLATLWFDDGRTK